MKKMISFFLLIFSFSALSAEAPSLFCQDEHTEMMVYQELGQIFEEDYLEMVEVPYTNLVILKHKNSEVSMKAYSVVNEFNEYLIVGENGLRLEFNQEEGGKGDLELTLEGRLIRLSLSCEKLF